MSNRAALVTENSEALFISIDEKALQAAIDTATIDTGTKFDKRDIWIMDSGATSFITPYAECLHELHDIEPVEITSANSNEKKMVAKQAGVLYIKTPETTIKISRALYVPKAVCNLFALNPLIQKDASISITKQYGLRVYDAKGKQIMHSPTFNITEAAFHMHHYDFIRQ